MQVFKNIAVSIPLVLFTGTSFAQFEHCQLGVEHAKKGDHFRAISQYTACVSLNVPKDVRARALRNRALSNGELKLFDDAIRDQREALSLEQPRNVWPLVMLSTYYRGAGRYDEALAALKASRQYDEDGPGTGPGMAVHYHTGQTLHLQGKFAEAIEEYSGGIPKQPTYGYAFYRRALAYEALGQREKAKTDLQRAADLEPSDGYEKDVAAKLLSYGLKVKMNRPANRGGSPT